MPLSVGRTLIGFALIALVASTLSPTVGLTLLGVGVIGYAAARAFEWRPFRSRAPRLTDAAFENATQPIVVLARDTRVVRANQLARAIVGAHGIAANDIAMCEKTLRENGAQFTAEEWADWWRELEAAGTTRAELTLRGRDGGLRPIEFKAKLLMRDGEPLAIVYLRDLSDRRRAQRVVEESERRFRALFEQAAVGMLQYATDGRILQVNRRSCEILGYSAEQLLSHDALQLTPNDDHATECGWHEALAAGNATSYTRERQIRHRNGGLVWLNISVSYVEMDDERYFIASLEDIHARKLAETRAEQLATHDALTNLPNRVLLLDRLDRALERARRNGKSVAVLHFDLDRFQKVTDTFGHAMGDLILLQVAQRLQAITRPEDTLARHQGDEFILLAQDLDGATGAAHIVETLLAAVQVPFEVQGHEIPLSASVGVALFPQDSWEPEALLRNADIALSHAKRASASTYEFFNPAMTQAAHQRLRMETALRRAIGRSELELHYQPQVDIGTGEVVGYEALARWRHPDLGLVPPDKFIPIAEETGLIIPIGEWVLDRACRQAAAWHRAGRPQLRMAINVSARQFADRCFATRLREIVLETGVNAARIDLEITESLVIDSSRALRAAFDAVKALGMRLSVDDFGTGYSNLQSLRRMPIDCVKIDRGFVRDLVARQNDQALVRAIIAMAHGLGLSVIAEGVETAEQLEFLRAAGCHQAQGYLFGKPGPPDGLQA